MHLTLYGSGQFMFLFWSNTPHLISLPRTRPSQSGIYDVLVYPGTTRGNSPRRSHRWDGRSYHSRNIEHVLGSLKRWLAWKTDGGYEPLQHCQVLLCYKYCCLLLQSDTCCGSILCLQDGPNEFAKWHMSTHATSFNAAFIDCFQPNKGSSVQQRCVSTVSVSLRCITSIFLCSVLSVCIA